MQKNEVIPYLTSDTKIYSKWIKELNIRAETIKLLEVSIEKKLHDIEFNNDFFGYDTKNKARKKKEINWPT